MNFLWLVIIMPLCEKIEYIHEPTDLQCGQAVLAMLAGVSVDEVVSVVGTDRETTLRDMFSALDCFGISYTTSSCAGQELRVQIKTKIIGNIFFITLLQNDST